MLTMHWILDRNGRLTMAWDDKAATPVVRPRNVVVLAPRLRKAAARVKNAAEALGKVA